MIIGRGLIARAFAPEWADREDVAVIAAGVSNSAERAQEEFDREKRLLQGVFAVDSLRKIVYFSSCAVDNPFEPPTPYIEHKARMEDLVLSDSRGLVFRLPQVVGSGGNPHTLTNFLSSSIESGRIFDVWTRAERNLIDVVDVAAIGGYIISNADRFSKLVPVADVRSSNMLTIVCEMERAMSRKGKYREIDRGAPFPIHTAECERAAAAIGSTLGPGYLRSLVAKYYGRKEFDCT